MKNKPNVVVRYKLVEELESYLDLIVNYNSFIQHNLKELNWCFIDVVNVE